MLETVPLEQDSNILKRINESSLQECFQDFSHWTWNTRHCLNSLFSSPTVLLVIHVLICTALFGVAWFTDALPRVIFPTPLCQCFAIFAFSLWPGFPYFERYFVYRFGRFGSFGSLAWLAALQCFWCFAVWFGFVVFCFVPLCLLGIQGYFFALFCFVFCLLLCFGLFFVGGVAAAGSAANISFFFRIAFCKDTLWLVSFFALFLSVAGSFGRFAAFIVLSICRNLQRPEPPACAVSQILPYRSKRCSKEGTVEWKEWNEWKDSEKMC